MRRVGWLGLAGALALTGCHKELAAHRIDPASFEVTILCAGKSSADCPTTCDPSQIKTPLDLGKPGSPVPGDQKFYLASVVAKGNDGELYPDYQGTANVHVMFNGSVSPPRTPGSTKAKQLKFKDGQACLQYDMPPAFNQTSIWVEDTFTKREDGSLDGSWAIGSSLPIYRPPPTVPDIQTTTDADTTASPLNLKQVIIKGGTNGAPLVVTSVTQTSFTVTDLGAPGDDHPWGSLLVFTFSKPYGVSVGKTVKNVAGALSEFNGLTELNFPSWEIDDKTPDTSRVPPAHEIVVVNGNNSDLKKTLEKMEPYESALVQVKGWKVCKLGSPGDRDYDAYAKFNQWKVSPILDLDRKTCDDSATSMSVPAAMIPSFKPLENAGKTFCSLKGILSQVIPGKGVNLWMIAPRGPEDLGTLVDDPKACP